MVALPPSGAACSMGRGDLMRASMTALPGAMPLFGRGPAPCTVNCTGPALELKPVLSTTLSVATYSPGGSCTVLVMPVAVAFGEPSRADLMIQPYATWRREGAQQPRQQPIRTHMLSKQQAG